MACQMVTREELEEIIWRTYDKKSPHSWPYFAKILLMHSAEDYALAVHEYPKGGVGAIAYSAMEFSRVNGYVRGADSDKLEECLAWYMSKVAEYESQRVS